MGRFDYKEYVSITMEFRCNLKCAHCMIERIKERLVPESLDRYKELLEYNKQCRKWKGLILTGSEITLRRDLPELVRMARRAGFERIRIQTHGMHLAQQSYCRMLVESGVNEFFVSVAGSDAESHDAITKIRGSFDRTLGGLENVEDFDGAISITNTVVTQENYRLLPEIVDKLKYLKNLVQMEFWFYWPMSETDEKNLIVSNRLALPFLRKAILKTRELGRGVEVKNFPECLLGDHRDVLDNSQPELFIDHAFWPEFNRNGFYQCVHYEHCSSQECLGLNTAYIAKYGWEEEHLHPLQKRYHHEKIG